MFLDSFEKLKRNFMKKADKAIRCFFDLARYGHDPSYLCSMLELCQGGLLQLADLDRLREMFKKDMSSLPWSSAYIGWCMSKRQAFPHMEVSFPLTHVIETPSIHCGTLKFKYAPLLMKRGGLYPSILRGRVQLVQMFQGGLVLPHCDVPRARLLGWVWSEHGLLWFGKLVYLLAFAFC